MLQSKWTQQAQWDGNPSLGYESYEKLYPNPLNHNRKTKVKLFGKDNNWNACISAGPNSDFSGCVWVPDNKEEAMQYLDEMFVNGILFR